MAIAKPPSTPNPETPSRAAIWQHRVALIATALTWSLLVVGGLVTTYRVGMAVPDWPTTFGINMFVYKFWNGPWGVYMEHSHRLYASFIGLVILVLTLWLLFSKARASVKIIGVLALLGVSLQGLLGGLRVTHNSTMLALVHGCSGQALFAILAALCVMTGADWRTPPEPRSDPSSLRIKTFATLGLIALQVILGAWVRHFSSGESLGAHSGFASLVFCQAMATVWSVERNRRDFPELVASARALALLLLVQVAFGVMAWWWLRPFDGIARVVTTAQAWIRTGHQANGALLIATATVLALRAARATASSLPQTSPNHRVSDVEAFA